MLAVKERDGLRKDSSSYSGLAIVTRGESLNVVEVLFRGWQRPCSRDGLWSAVGEAVAFGIDGFDSTYQLCDLGLLQPLFPHLVNADDNRTHLTGLEE